LVVVAGGTISRAFEATFGAASAAETELRTSAATNVSVSLVMVDLLCVVSGLAQRRPLYETQYAARRKDWR